MNKVDSVKKIIKNNRIIYMVKIQLKGTTIMSNTITRFYIIRSALLSKNIYEKTEDKENQNEVRPSYSPALTKSENNSVPKNEEIKSNCTDDPKELADNKDPEKDIKEVGTDLGESILNAPPCPTASVNKESEKISDNIEKSGLTDVFIECGMSPEDIEKVKSNVHGTNDTNDEESGFVVNAAKPDSKRIEPSAVRNHGPLPVEGKTVDKSGKIVDEDNKNIVGSKVAQEIIDNYKPISRSERRALKRKEREERKKTKKLKKNDKSTDLDEDLSTEELEQIEIKSKINDDGFYNARQVPDEGNIEKFKRKGSKNFIIISVALVVIFILTLIAIVLFIRFMI